MRTRTVIASLAAFLFGWGSLWAVSTGISMAWNGAVHGNSAAIIEAATLPDTAPQDQKTSEQGDLNITVPKIIEPEPQRSSDEVTVMMGGDVMFDRAVRKIGEVSGYDGFFADIASLFKKADIAVVNLEGPITSNPSQTLLTDGHTSDSLNFTFDPSTAAVLYNAGIDIVSLANNHTDNAGSTGFAETKRWLRDAGVKYFGDPWNDPGTESVITKNGIKVAFVGYHAFQPGFPKIIAEVKRLSAEGDFVIVMPHWGVEYSPTANADQRAKAQELVAAGAGAVIGSHPHVVEDDEWIGASPVYYSLGNLLFDQYFSPETMKGEVVELRIGRGTNGPALDQLLVYEVSLASHKLIKVSP